MPCVYLLSYTSGFLNPVPPFLLFDLRYVVVDRGVGLFSSFLFFSVSFLLLGLCRGRSSLVAGCAPVSRPVDKIAKGGPTIDSFLYRVHTRDREEPKLLVVLQLTRTWHVAMHRAHRCTGPRTSRVYLPRSHEKVSWLLSEYFRPIDPLGKNNAVASQRNRCTAKTPAGAFNWIRLFFSESSIIPRYVSTFYRKVDGSKKLSASVKHTLG